MPTTFFPAASFSLEGWSHVVIAGEDAKTFLQGFCTNDVLRLHPGQGCETFLPDIRGRILAHVLVFAEANALRLIAVPGSGPTIVSHLRKYLLDGNAEIIDRTAETDLICLAGSEIEDVLRVAPGVELPSQIGNHTTVTTAAGPLLVGRTPLTCPANVLVLGSPEAVAAVRAEWPREIVDTGSPETFEMLRIEAGFPWHGRDIGLDLIAQEAGRTDRTIHFKKGCYLGQEPIARLDALGHTNKELRCLVVDAEQVATGSEIRFHGATVGAVTSACPASRPGKSVALGIVRTKANAPGTAVTVSSGGRECAAVVHWPHISSLD